jgi:hypothetical protein
MLVKLFKNNNIYTTSINFLKKIHLLIQIRKYFFFHKITKIKEELYFHACFFSNETFILLSDFALLRHKIGNFKII